MSQSPGVTPRVIPLAFPRDISPGKVHLRHKQQEQERKAKVDL